jgi:hypothetical protein
MNSQAEKFFEEVRVTAAKLDQVGMSGDAGELQNFFYGSTGGEVYGALGCALKRIVADPRLPQALIPELLHEISQIDAAYDRIGQPRPFTMKVES